MASLSSTARRYLFALGLTLVAYGLGMYGIDKAAHKNSVATASPSVVAPVAQPTPPVQNPSVAETGPQAVQETDVDPPAVPAQEPESLPESGIAANPENAPVEQERPSIVSAYAISLAKAREAAASNRPSDVPAVSAYASQSAAPVDSTGGASSPTSSYRYVSPAVPTANYRGYEPQPPAARNTTVCCAPSAPRVWQHRSPRARRR